MSISLVMNGTEPELSPDDYFQEFGITAREWLGGAPCESIAHSADVLAEKCAVFRAANILFEVARANSDDILRHEPWVIEEYNSIRNAATYLFIFKCENNGNTYRVRYDPLFSEKL